MSQVAKSTRIQEEYEDDFEKDLDWLISEEGKSDGQDPDYEDIEAKIDEELEEENHEKKVDKKIQKESSVSDDLEEDRWPSPMEPLEFDSDRDSPYKGSTLIAPPPPVLEDELDEEKKYILEKIQLANQQLRDQEAPDMRRRRRLQFKDSLVDLVVSPVEDNTSTTHTAGVVDQENHSPAIVRDMEVDKEVSNRLSDLRISQQLGEGGRGGQETKAGNGALNRSLEVDQVGHGREGRVLVEKDGKFDLVCVKEVESQGLMLPTLASSSSYASSTPCLSERNPRCASASSSLRPISSTFSLGDKQLHSPRPPAKPRIRPTSASHSQRGSGGRLAKRRVQSANSTPSQQSTFTLSQQQKGLLNKIQERRERLAREEEQKKRNEQEQKRQENERAFRAWLGRKTEQLQEDRRIHRAQEMERMNDRKEHSEPDEAFRSWLQRKQQQQQRERHLEELKRLEEENGFYLRNREECERAFKQWLRRKREEKRAEQHAARERSRRLLFEERRSRRMQDLTCTVNETIRFNEPLTHRF